MAIRFPYLIILLVSLTLRCDFFAQSKDTLIKVQLGNKNEYLNTKVERLETIEVSTATLSDLDLNEAPSLISVISRDEILKNGYNDLTEILNTIPGFSLATDVLGAISFGIRGVWANEGRMLVLLDGIPMNELAYGSFVVGGRMDVRDIERIEVIRGPGSAVFGGVAACGVINIFSRSVDKFRGTQVNIGSGISSGKISHGNVTTMFGNQFSNGLKWKFSGNSQTSNRSNRTLTQSDTTSVSFADSSRTNNISFNSSIEINGFKSSLVYDNYEFIDPFTRIQSINKIFIYDAEYAFKIRQTKIKAFAQFNKQRPWNTVNAATKDLDNSNLSTLRIRIGAVANSVLGKNKRINILYGGEIYRDKYNRFNPGKNLQNGAKSNEIYGTAVFVEFSRKSKYVNIFIGARFDDYASFGPKLNPRISFTKNFKKWHYKLIGNQAVKMPTFSNINLQSNQKIQPELMRTTEIEFGYHLKFLDLQISFFDLELSNIILFDYNKITLQEGYINQGKQNNQGLDFQAKLKLNKVIFSTMYSTYFVSQNSEQSILIDSSNIRKGALAFPKHKINLRGSYQFKNNLSLAIAFSIESARVGYVQSDQLQNSVKATFAPRTDLNISLNKEGFWNDRGSCTVGFKNLLNAKNYIVYPFSSGYHEIPSMGLSFFTSLRLSIQ